EARARFDRCFWASFFPAALHDRAHDHRLAVLHGVLPDQRAILQRRRPAAMAGEISRTALLLPAFLPGNFRADQAHRRDARAYSRSPCGRASPGRSRGAGSDRSDLDRRSKEGGPAVTAFLVHNMAPLMFASLVVVLLLGYPAAFSLAAIGLIYGVIGIE